MVGTESLAVGAVVAATFAGWFLKRIWGGRRSADERESRERHEAAREREPPVDIGDVCEVGIEEFTTHHSGERRAVGRVEGFVVFVKDVPEDVAVAEAVRIKILSFNRGRTSATATYLETA